MTLDSSSPVPVEQKPKQPRKHLAKKTAVWIGFVLTSTILVNGMAVLVLMVPKEQTVNRMWATAGLSFLTVFALGVNFLLWKLTNELWTE